MTTVVVTGKIRDSARFEADVSEFVKFISNNPRLERYTVSKNGYDYLTVGFFSSRDGVIRHEKLVSQFMTTHNLNSFTVANVSYIDASRHAMSSDNAKRVGAATIYTPVSKYTRKNICTIM